MTEYFFQNVGRATCVAFGMLIAILILKIVTELIKCFVHYLKRQHQIRHRFDKPPTAKCYCIDCKYRFTHTDQCNKFRGMVVPDDWFCGDAEPTKYSQIKKKRG